MIKLIDKLRKKIADFSRLSVIKLIHFCAIDDQLFQIIVLGHYRRRKNDLLGQVKMVGENIAISGDIVITQPEYLTLGSHVHIGRNVYLESSGGIIFGDSVTIEDGVSVFTEKYNNNDAESSNILVERHSVIIEKKVKIGRDVRILPGVRIGENSVVEHGATIIKSIPKNTLIVNDFHEFPKIKYIFRHIQHDNKLSKSPSDAGILPTKCNGIDKGKDLFFVISTGRSGSTSIAKILSQHKNINCYHEANRQLIKISTELCHGEISLDTVKEYLRTVYCDTSIFSKDGVVGESNLKLANMINLLAELLPDSKFIWLTRDGRNFVSSALNREWFSESIEEFKNRHQWSEYRLSGARSGIFSEDEWGNMSTFQRCCWYWSYWNEIILTQLNSINRDRWMILKMEDFDQEIGNVVSFLGVSKEKLSVSKDNIAEKNIGYPSKEWNEKDQNTFITMCHEMMDYLGYRHDE